MENCEVIVKVPASTANLGSGFDTIGMALSLYTTIKMKKASLTTVVLNGPNLDGVPKNKDNLIYKVAALLFEKAGIEIPELYIEVSSEIPLTRGLGSSGAAIVGGMMAANVLAGDIFSRDEIYTLATEFEGHPDNVGASLFGGVVIATWVQGKVTYINTSPPTGVKAVIAIPNFELSTKKARDVLPKMYAREDAVYALSHSALLAAALISGNTSVLYDAMQDRIHQPYRMELVPGLSELLTNAHKNGALAIALSGAGPTVLALTTNEEAQLYSILTECVPKA